MSIETEIRTLTPTLDHRIGQSLKDLRRERGWSLEDLAKRTGVSRATLSRVEAAEVSPTTATLAKLCAAFGIQLSHLMLELEDGFTPLIQADRQTVWQDPAGGLTRRLISPPAHGLKAEVLECTLEAGQDLIYEHPPKLGQEHHLLMLSGSLTLSFGPTVVHHLKSGDCLRYRLDRGNRFSTSPEEGARYLLVIV
ncbi:MAG: helix-turn-helix domain-containing protein [Rhodospirillaceae bacterium]